MFYKDTSFVTRNSRTDTKHRAKGTNRGWLWSLVADVKMQ